jgi:hypothetical protein
VAILGEVPHLPTVKAGSFGAWLLIILLFWGICYVVVFGLHGGGVGIGVVALVLASIVWHSSL